jgi:hypothetical protein
MDGVAVPVYDTFLVTLRPRDYAANFELVITDRAKNECRVIALSDDQVAWLAGKFSDAVIERHYYQKRLARHPVTPSLASGHDLAENVEQHQQAAE